MNRLSIILALMMLAAGCGDHVVVPVDYPPSAPAGLYSVTGDGRAILYWNPNPEPDIDLYAVYSAERNDGYFELEDVTRNTYYTFYLPNGTTRYFAVVAVDFAGNESELSYETVWDTPRPEGHNMPVYALFYDPQNTNFDRCGIDFSDYMHRMIQSLDNPSNDIYIDNYEGTLFLNAFDDDTDIAMFGLTSSLSDVDYADPDIMEWDSEGYLALYEDYSYVIWTWDNHFATVRVQEVYDDMAVLEWAYQTDPGNPQLKIGGGKRRQESERSLKRRIPKIMPRTVTDIIIEKTGVPLYNHE